MEWDGPNAMLIECDTLSPDVYIPPFIRSVGGFSSGGFSPSDIAGLQLWLKADAITGLNDGDAITTWADSSGNSLDATQSTAAMKPLYKTAILNGLPVVRFDGVRSAGLNDRLVTPSFQSFPSKRGTFIVAFKQGSLAGPYAPVLTTYPAANPFQMVTAVSGPKYKWYDGADYLSSNYDAAAFELQSFTRDGDTSLKFHRNASLADSFTVGNTQQSASVLGIGDNPSGVIQACACDIAEILFYDTALSTTERQAVESYLNSKWAIY